MSTLIIYSPRSTQRLDYILNIILKDRLGISFSLTTSLADYQASTLPRFSYGPQPVDEGVFIASARLLFERGITPDEVSFSNCSHGPALFCTGHRASAWPFDLFSASFYLLTRYEEYLPFKADQHKRFDLQQSMLRHDSRHLTPWVDRWVYAFGKWLAQTFPQLEVTLPQYSFQPTYDIDIPYAFRLKGLFRNLGAFSRDFLSGKFAQIRERSAVVFGRRADPFDTFRLMFDLHKDQVPLPVFFFLYAQYSEFDKNPATHNPKFRSLIKKVRDYATVGIHPSYFSSEHHEYLRNEVQALSSILNENVKLSRQHFLRLQIPETYRNLSALGIEEDFSMGFASSPGFRAGTSIPYRFYDLEYEMTMSMKVVPFTVMDGSLLDYMGLSPDEALQLCLKLLEEVKDTGGVFTTLWHNESLSEYGRWKGWRQMYIHLLASASIVK